jgi:predicted enzyme related to lactoylglutathione lyase
MLHNAIIKAFVPTTKPAEAKLFYKDILGLKLLSEDDYALEFEANGVLLRVAIVPELKPHAFTALGWNVPDISSTIKSLNEKGVQFKRYDFMKQDSLGIWTSPNGSKVAWFSDPDDNVISLTEI